MAKPKLKPIKGFPVAEHPEAAMRRASSSFIETRRLCKTWIGPGTDEALMGALKETRRVLSFLTYLYLTYQYSKIYKEHQDQLADYQWDLFNALSPLLVVAQKRGLI